MSHLVRSRLCVYSPQQMFDIVNDTNRYPEFIPWCTHAENRVISQEVVEASLVLKKGPFVHRFTTSNTLAPPHTITMHLVDGPFSKLIGRWQFKQERVGCLVRFELDYTLSSVTLGAVFSPIFESLANGMVDNFITRANCLYDAP